MGDPRGRSLPSIFAGRVSSRRGRDNARRLGQTGAPGPLTAALGPGALGCRGEAEARASVTQRGARCRLQPRPKSTAASPLRLHTAGSPLAPAAVAHEDWQDMIWGLQPLATSFGTLSVSHQTSINISNTSASLTTKSSITHA